MLFSLINNDRNSTFNDNIQIRIVNGTKSAKLKRNANGTVSNIKRKSHKMIPALRPGRMQAENSITLCFPQHFQ
jgi:hypothetical protein